MLQATQFETVLYINVELDSSLGLKKTYILKVCLWLECRKKMNIISNIYTRMNSMDFYKMKKNIQYRDFLQYLQLIL